MEAFVLVRLCTSDPDVIEKELVACSLSKVNMTKMRKRLNAKLSREKIGDSRYEVEPVVFTDSVEVSDETAESISPRRMGFLLPAVPR